MKTPSRCGLIALAIVVLGLVDGPGDLSARDFPWAPPQLPKLDDRCEPGLERAGHPECVAWWARPGYCCQENGYYVGGGLPFHGHAHREYDGTWGWDFLLHGLPPHVRLKWSNGERYQNGPGQYKTDGPKLRAKD